VVSSSNWKGAGDEAEKNGKVQKDFHALQSSMAFFCKWWVSADSF